jgi:hypothetical protein
MSDGHGNTRGVPPGDGRQNLHLMAWARGFDLFGDVFRYGFYLGLAYIGFRAVEVLAGKSTSASFIFNALFSDGNDYGLPWVLSVVFLVWGIAQRRERLRKTEYFQNRIQKLEKMLDPDRTSSGLSTTGETHPGDRLL